MADILAPMESELRATGKADRAGAGRGGRAKFLAFTVLALLILHFPLLLHNARDLCDDALISARYGRNLARGYGLTYNRVPGLRPVEGYTNFLWVMGLAAGESQGLNPRQTTAGLGAGWSFISCLVLWWWVRRETRSEAAALGAALVLGSCLPYAVWAVQGLETAMFAAFVLLAAASMRKEPGPAPYLFALAACFTRPDGLIVFAAVLAVHLLTPDRDYREIAARALMWFIAPFTVYTLMRWHYFGSLLPNTFHAKTGLGWAGVPVGLDYLAGWALNWWPLCALLIIGLTFSALGRRLGASAAVRTAALIVILYFIFIAAVGGDFMPDHRFVMHVLPLVIGAGAIAAKRMEAMMGGRRLVFASLVLCALAWNLFRIAGYEAGDSFAKHWHREQLDWYGPLAEWLTEQGGRTAVTALGDIGYVGYYTDADWIIDTNGLVDPYLGSLPGAAGLESDPDYVLDLHPDFLVVMVHYFDNGAVVGHSGFDRAVLASDRLAREYDQVTELPGWSVTEKSLDDGTARSSQVQFRLFRSRDKD